MFHDYLIPTPTSFINIASEIIFLSSHSSFLIVDVYKVFHSLFVFPLSWKTLERRHFFAWSIVFVLFTSPHLAVNKILVYESPICCWFEKSAPPLVQVGWFKIALSTLAWIFVFWHERHVVFDRLSFWTRILLLQEGACRVPCFCFFFVCKLYFVGILKNVSFL